MAVLEKPFDGQDSIGHIPDGNISFDLMRAMTEFINVLSSLIGLDVGIYEISHLVSNVKYDTTSLRDLVVRICHLINGLDARLDARIVGFWCQITNHSSNKKEGNQPLLAV